MRLDAAEPTTSSTADFQWQTATPESQGLSSAALDAARESLARNKTKTLLIVRGDRIVYEWYAEGFDAKRPHHTASLAKAMIGGVSLMLAMDDGRISPDDPACKFVPAWKDDPQKSKILVRHLATHTSGIEDAEKGDLPHDQLPGWKGAFWKREPDPFTISRDQAPMLFAPGTSNAYSNPGMAMLAWCVTASLKDAPQADIRSLLRERVMKPIGISDDEWSIGYNKTYTVDGLPLVANWGGANFTARATARVGRLMLRRGDWDGARLISADSIDQAITPAKKAPKPDRSKDSAKPLPGFGWWLNRDGAWKSLPIDAYAGAGAGNQLLVVIPSLDMIVVRNGGALGDKFWSSADELLFAPLMKALLPPYPPSPVITGIEWAPAETVVRKSEDSDTWANTWADDDAIYTSWADGQGFEPRAPKKLSMGFARVTGGPDDFQGVNIPSPTGERMGGGKNGEKVSGMLMVDGVLYIWARNADRNGNSCRLAWSTDHAATWTWSDWSFEEFGYCTFLNFGRNYAGARDGYVYVYSHDNPSAYVAADRMILMRVPKEKIRDRAAYEFFAGLGADGQPRWSADVAQRGAVFTHARHCLRTSASYCAPLKRYLSWHQSPVPGGQPDTRFVGGFAVYDAPEPWGPWTTVYYTERWDMGPGETASFPTKWMSADGKTLHIVFSGEDAFSVRKATLTLAPKQ